MVWITTSQPSRLSRRTVRLSVVVV